MNSSVATQIYFLATTIIRSLSALNKIFREKQLCFKMRLKQTYTHFEIIAELDPFMS